MCQISGFEEPLGNSDITRIIDTIRGIQLSTLGPQYCSNDSLYSHYRDATNNRVISDKYDKKLVAVI